MEEQDIEKILYEEFVGIITEEEDVEAVNRAAKRILAFIANLD